MSAQDQLTLAALKPGQKAVVVGFVDGPLTQRMMEMGLTPGSSLEVKHRAPFGGAMAVLCRGTLIALRLSDARLVEVSEV